MQSSGESVIAHMDTSLPLHISGLAILPSYSDVNLSAEKSFSPIDVQSALTFVLASKEFSKARRTCRLLRFLVEKSLAGDLRETSEYAIGIAVFDRDSGTYSTGDDPIVRIQVGRLRGKLKAYYAATGAHVLLRFLIPVGSYMPIIQNMPIQDVHVLPDSNMLAMLPLIHLSEDAPNIAFAKGLNEELSFQLFKELSAKIVSHAFISTSDIAQTGIRHRLEGSIRFNGDVIRVALRLIDTSVGYIVWSEQFDHGGAFSIAVQEELAKKICRSLKLYLRISCAIYADGDGSD